LRLGESVQLLGSKPNAAVKDLLADADLFVLPCGVDPCGDRDGIPVVLMEAMAAGACVISGDLPAIRELVRHEETGLLVPPGDVSALTTALRRGLGDAQLRQRLGEWGRRWVQVEFSAEKNLRRLLLAFADAGVQGLPAGTAVEYSRDGHATPPHGQPATTV